MESPERLVFSAGKSFKTLSLAVIVSPRFPDETANSIPGCEPVRPFAPDIDLRGIEGIIHLAGESILGLWTKQKRDKILHSRIDGTRWIVDAISQARNKPSVLVSASGAGIYGNRGEETLTESSLDKFSRFSGRSRNRLGEPRAESRSRRCPIRSGPNCSGAGKEWRSHPFDENHVSIGLGGKLGSGKQWMPWIHVADVAALFLHAVETASVRGPINGASPNPVRNEEFTKIMGELLRRPTLVAAPEFALRMLPANEASLVLDSQRIIPEKALQTGFKFRFPDLQWALTDILT